MKNKELKNYLKNIEPIVQGVISLFFPHVEGAIHDLSEGKIYALYNNISKRAVGDRSPLEELKIPVEKFPDVFEPYMKDNWDGRELKCTSITIRDENEKPIALICFNMDTTVFKNIGNQIEQLLKVTTSSLNPIEKFSQNWKVQMDEYISEFVQSEGQVLENLSKEQRQKLVKKLYDHGLFNFKNSANYIARKMGVSRASIYNYLN